MITQNIKLSGLHCPACKKLTEKRIGSLPGVINVTVNIESGTAIIESENEISVSLITMALTDTPYSIIEDKL